MTLENYRRIPGPPGADDFGTTDRTTTSSPSFNSPCRSAAISVYEWSVIPREIFTGSRLLSAWIFHTTALSARGTRGGLWFAPPLCAAAGSSLAGFFLLLASCFLLLSHSGCTVPGFPLGSSV